MRLTWPSTYHTPHRSPPSTEKIRRAKVDLELVRSLATLEANRAYTHVMLDPRHVDTDKRIWQAASICA